MAVLFFNIRSKEIRSADSEPMIAALYNSSDLGPNAKDGQDFGWRLHPQVVVRIRGIKVDPRTLESIAVRYSTPVNEIDDKLILAYISEMDKAASVEEKTLTDFEDEYREEIRRLEALASQTKK